MERMPAILAATALLAVAFTGTAAAQYQPEEKAGVPGLLGIRAFGPGNEGASDCGGVLLTWVTVAGGYDGSYELEVDPADESLQVPGDRYYWCVSGHTETIEIPNDQVDDITVAVVDEETPDTAGLWKETNGDPGLQTEARDEIPPGGGDPVTVPPDTHCTGPGADALSCAPTAVTTVTSLP